MSEKRRHLFAAAACLALAAPPVMALDPYSDDDILRHFDTIVFNSEHREMKVQKVRKWVAPIRIYLEVRVPDARYYHKLTQATVDKLAAASGHDIRIVEQKDKANVISTFDRIQGLLAAVEHYFPGEVWIKELVNTNLCIGRFYANERGEIYKANIFIPTDRSSSAGMLPACIIEETAQVLGLPNDSDEFHVSIFNDKSKYIDLTVHDLTLIRMLYDPRLKPGMAREEALEVLRQIVPEFRN